MHELNTLTCIVEMSDIRRNYLLERGIIQRDLVNGGYSVRPSGPVAPDDFEALVSLGDTHYVGDPDQRIHYTVVFLFSKGYHQVLLVKKNHPKWQAGRWNGVGGRAEVGEAPLQCAVREFEEETALRIPVEAMREFLVLEDSQSIVHFFTSELPISLSVPHENDRGERLQWHTVDHEMGGLLEWRDPRQAIDNLCWLVPMAYSDRFHAGGRVQSWRRGPDGERVE